MDPVQPQNNDNPDDDLLAELTASASEEQETEVLPEPTKEETSKAAVFRKEMKEVTKTPTTTSKIKPSISPAIPVVANHKIHFYKQIAYTFIGAALVVLAGLIYFSLSQAVITVKGGVEEVQTDFQILLKTDTDQTDVGINARLVATEVEFSKEGQSAVLEQGADKAALGEVTLINTSSTAQPLVEKTRLLSEEGVLFRLSKAVTVPAKGEVVAEVYADVAGVGGEIAPSRFTIPGLNQDRQQEVYAQSKSAFTGGTEAVYKVTQEQVDELIAQAQSEIAQQAMMILQEESIESADFLPNAQSIEILEQTVSPEVDTDAATFTVTLKAYVLFVQAEETDLQKLAQQNFYKNSSLGYEVIVDQENNDLQYELVNIDKEKQSAQLRVMQTGKRRISLNHPSLNVANFAGKKPDEVQVLLQTEPAIEEVSVQLRPFWQRRVPRLVDHIYIQFSE